MVALNYTAGPKDTESTHSALSRVLFAVRRDSLLPADFSTVVLDAISYYLLSFVAVEVLGILGTSDTVVTSLWPPQKQNMVTEIFVSP